MGNLKACPFCKDGGNPQVREFEDAYPDVGWSLPDYRVVCNTCGSMGRLANTKDEAIEGWNTRNNIIIVN